jgi:ABC-type antimicrobial peptide transport system permease subunit
MTQTCPKFLAWDGVPKEVEMSFRTASVFPRLLAVLSGFFGVLVVFLATIGLCGTLVYLVSQRQDDFGLCMALGAGAWPMRLLGY